MVEIMRRGKVFLAPLKHKHIDALEANMNKECVNDLNIMGYEVRDAMEVALEASQSYVVQHDEAGILAVCGLMPEAGIEQVQMYGLFTDAAKNHAPSLLRGSRMLLKFFELQSDGLCMTIRADHEIMLQWAAWLGFEATGVSNYEGHGYVNFVRCGCIDCRGENAVSRPVMH